MKFIQKSSDSLWRWLLIVGSVLIVGLILWNTSLLISSSKEDERQRMELWALAQKELLKTTDLNSNIGEVSFKILTENTKNPMILVDENGEILRFSNIDERRALKNDSTYLKSILKRIRLENPPIQIRYGSDVNQTLYYGHSALLKKIRFYPLALFSIVLVFATILFVFYKTSRVAIQNKLWTGMAKETAHQIGTPLSSLMGWVALLESEKISKDALDSMKKDLKRLETITDRFSKIGSNPSLSPTDIIKETQSIVTYLKERSSSLIAFDINLPDQKYFTPLSSALYGWVIENLIKNGIDAMKGEGTIRVETQVQDHFIKIMISDTGSGIPKKLQKTIFSPGVTNKKRGWGLGLSLAKRIVEDYHNGFLRLKETHPEKGTTMEIVLKLITKDTVESD